MSTQIILTPGADHHRTGRAWQALQREWLRQLAPAEVSIAETPEQAEEIARTSALKGYQKIIAVGDSGTAHGVVNGLMGLAEVHRLALQVGFLSITRPGEWARTINFPRRWKRQLEILKAGHTMPYDLGRVDCLGAQGRPVTRYFLNGAGFGLGGRLRHEWAGHPGKRSEAVGGILRALGDFLQRKDPLVRLETESRVLYEGPCSLGMVMGGRFYPVLGEVAPHASPTDGELDAVWVGGKTLLQSLMQFWRMVAPRPDGLEGPGGATATSFRASTLEGPVFLEADGQLVGRLPATFMVVPRSLPVIVPEVGVRVKKPRFAPIPVMGENGILGSSKAPLG